MVYNLWHKWLLFGEWLGTRIGKAILTVFYFSLFAIPAIFLTYVFDKFGKKDQEVSYFSDNVDDLKVIDMDHALEM